MRFSDTDPLPYFPDSSPVAVLPGAIPGSCRRNRLKIFAPAGQSVYRTALPFLQVVIIPSPDNRFVCHEIDGPAMPRIPAISFRETSGEEARISRILRASGSAGAGFRPGSL